MTIFNLWGYLVDERRDQDEHDDAKQVTRYAFVVTRAEGTDDELSADIIVSRAEAQAALIGLPAFGASALRERARYLARIKASLAFKEHDNKQREGE